MISFRIENLYDTVRKEYMVGLLLLWFVPLALAAFIYGYNVNCNMLGPLVDYD